MMIDVPSLEMEGNAQIYEKSSQSLRNFMKWRGRNPQEREKQLKK